MILTVSHLEAIQESEKLTGVIKEIISILLAAINDWPTPIISLANYEEEIYEILGDVVDKKTMEKYITDIDYSKNAWQGESLSQLMDIFDYYEEGKPLKEVFAEIQRIVAS